MTNTQSGIEPGGISFEAREFTPSDIFLCGQCFRWRKEPNGSFTLIAFGERINVEQREERIYLWGANPDSFSEIWSAYFDLDTDYSVIQQELSSFDELKDPILFGKGIRILRQEPFETIISFIISANSNIPRIQRSLETISRLYGSQNGRLEDPHYAFPTPEQLSHASTKDLRGICKLGYRDEYVLKSAKRISNGDFDLQNLEKLETEELRSKLQELPGVGPKVADCILLFAYGRREVFPIDTWVTQAMTRISGHPLRQREIRQLAGKTYGHLAGYAQQYLFHYYRNGGDVLTPKTKMDERNRLIEK